MTRTDAITFWTAPDRQTFAAEEDGRVLDPYYLRANLAGGGAHVANCGCITSGEARGRGVARAMGEQAVAEPRI